MTNSWPWPGPAVAAVAVIVIATVVVTIAFLAADAPVATEEPIADYLVGFAVAFAIVIVAAVAAANNSIRRTGPGCSWPCGDLSASEAALLVATRGALLAMTAFLADSNFGIASFAAAVAGLAATAAIAAAFAAAVAVELTAADFVGASGHSVPDSATRRRACADSREL